MWMYLYPLITLITGIIVCLPSIWLYQQIYEVEVSTPKYRHIYCTLSIQGLYFYLFDLSLVPQVPSSSVNIVAPLPKFCC